MDKRSWKEKMLRFLGVYLQVMCHAYWVWMVSFRSLQTEYNILFKLPNMSKMSCEGLAMLDHARARRVPTPGKATIRAIGKAFPSQLVPQADSGRRLAVKPHDGGGGVGFHQQQSWEMFGLLAVRWKSKEER